MARPHDKDVVLDDNGTLWVTTDDVEKVGRVIVVDDKSHWCLTFYTYPTEKTVRHGRWEYHKRNQRDCVASCSVCRKRTTFFFKSGTEYCPFCGARMDMDEEAPE